MAKLNLPLEKYIEVAEQSLLSILAKPDFSWDVDMYDVVEARAVWAWTRQMDREYLETFLPKAFKEVQ